jgi:transcriptional antiterminator NusG
VEENEKGWFVVHTYSGYEERAKRNLEQRIKFMDVGDTISQVIIPTEEEIEVRNGQRQMVTKKILPGYILVQMRLNDQSWNIVRNTPGVTGFVGSGNKPTPLGETEVSQILKQMAAEAPKVKIGFRQGQSIRVTDGPFIDFVGVVDEISPEKGKAKVLLSLFGRETPVELDFLQMEKL